MSKLVLHCGGERVTRAMVDAVVPPAATDTYKPVHYGDAIDLLHEEARGLGMQIRKEDYGLNEKGDQLFALLTLDTGNPEHGLSIGLRQSYNKSLALGVAIGAQVFVCDNLAFSGSAFKVVRKNTVNVWPDFRNLLRAQISDALPQYRKLESDFGRMKEIPCSIDRGFSVLGMMVGHELLTAQQASVAFGDWREPRHGEFGERNVWGLYNAVTEGLKKGGAGSVLTRHSAAHDWILTEAVPRLARKAQVISVTSV
jgi:hypothetical protein